MGELRTEYEVTCPCCQSTLVIDEGLKRVVRHTEPERADKPKLDDAHQILADAKARRDALFEQSVQSEKTRGDALSKRFEEALRQAKDEPVTKPSRDFDLD
jgi:deoxycytidylate deaminase